MLSKRSYKYIIAVVALFILFSPLFIVIYRLLLFQTTPLDNYHDYSAFYAGINPSYKFESPLGYRIYFPLVSAIIFKISPIIELTKSKTIAISPEWIQIYQAQALNCYSHIIACLLVSYLYLKKFLKGQLLPILLSLIGFAGLLFYTSFTSIDPSTIFIILLLIVFLDKKIMFGSLMLLTPLINEKIGIVFCIYFFLKLLEEKNKEIFFFLGVSLGTVALYFLCRFLFPFPGNEDQVVISSYANHFVSRFTQIFSIKGLYMNVFPALLLIGVFFYASPIETKNHLHYCKYLPILTIILFFLASATADAYTPGRIALHSLPFYLPYLLKTSNKITS